MRVLGLIPARAGSKGIAGKNLASLDGRPLVAHSIAAGLASTAVDRVVVSTDGTEIAAAARAAGAEVPFMRPADLAGDDVSDLPVIVHALTALADAGDHFDAVALLRPTTPFRKVDLIERCVAKLVELDADSVRSVRDVGHAHPYWMLELDRDGLAQPVIPGRSVDRYYQRQLLPPVYRHDGYCDVFRTRHLPERVSPDAGLAALYGERRGAVVNTDSEAVNIDTPEDLARARRRCEVRGTPGEVRA